MNRIFAASLAVVIACVFVAAQGGPPPPGGKTQPITQHKKTPQQIAKTVDMTCPIKGQFSVNYKAVGGAVVDKDVKFTSGEFRYCRFVSDLVYCNQNNPTPNIPCKLIERLAPRFACPLVSSSPVNLSSNKSLGPWSVDKNTNVLFELHLCHRAWLLDSCRYWHQESAVTIFKNAGLFSVDRKTDAKFTVCEVDQKAENEYQERLKKAKDSMIALLQIKHDTWNKQCPAGNKACLAKVTELAIKAQLDGNEMLAYTYDANLSETMKAIAKKYDPLIAEAVKPWK